MAIHEAEALRASRTAHDLEILEREVGLALKRRAETRAGDLDLERRRFVQTDRGRLQPGSHLQVGGANHGTATARAAGLRPSDRAPRGARPRVTNPSPRRPGSRGVLLDRFPPPAVALEVLDRFEKGCRLLLGHVGLVLEFREPALGPAGPGSCGALRLRALARIRLGVRWGRMAGMAAGSSGFAGVSAPPPAPCSCSPWRSPPGASCGCFACRWFSSSRSASSRFHLASSDSVSRRTRLLERGHRAGGVARREQGAAVVVLGGAAGGRAGRSSRRVPA